MRDYKESNSQTNGRKSRWPMGPQKLFATTASITRKIRGPMSPWKLSATLASALLLILALTLSGLLIPGRGDGDKLPPAGPVDTVPDSSDTSFVFGSVVPTNKWMNFYGLESTLDGQLLPVGAVITAHDPQGVVCGEFSVTQAGRYGLMPVYSDDPSTEADEGAVPGDFLEFRVNGIQATMAGPDEPFWTAMGDLNQVNLAGYSTH